MANDKDYENADDVSKKRQSIRHKNCVAMILAGGQGSRLYTLTEKTAKPAVAFGGKYRIIDFTLSNCINSGIDTVGVLTQYQPLDLNEYIGNGQPWDLDRNFGGVMILPPYQGKKKADWYRGTANAVYQNLNFIDKYSPEYVIILSGDHIYSADYSEMIGKHISYGADCTIAVIDVPPESASRFGILTVDETGRITEFEEKPKHPKSTLASMGVYVFSTDILKKYLTLDADNPDSSNDFGKNVIPTMLNDGMKLYTWAFSDYWKDVGTLESYWEANMDLLGDRPKFDLHNRRARILSRNTARAPQYIGENAVIRDSLVTEGCEIYGEIEHSVIFNGVIVEKGASVKNSVIMDNTVIKSGSHVEYSIIDRNTLISKNCIIGDSKESGNGICVIGSGNVISSGERIEGGKRVSL